MSVTDHTITLMNTPRLLVPFVDVFSCDELLEKSLDAFKLPFVPFPKQLRHSLLAKAEIF